MSSFDHEAFWSARYLAAGDDYLFGTAPNTFLAAQADHFRAGMQVLSVADGEGRNAVWLAEQGCQVTATEISPVALEKAARLARLRQMEVDFQCVDILNWAWPVQAFDAVAGIFIQFVGPEARVRLFHGMMQALRPGGLLLIPPSSSSTARVARQRPKISTLRKYCVNSFPAGKSCDCGSMKTFSVKGRRMPVGQP